MTSERSRALLVDDDPSFLDVVQTALLPNFRVTVATSFREAHRITDRSGLFDLILLDLGLPDGDGLSLLPHLRKSSPSASVIVVTMAVDIRKAVKAIQLGADDYVTKDLGLEELLRVVDRVLSGRKKERELASLRYASHLRPRELLFSENSPSMSSVLQMIREVAPLPATVLLEGESGTGKELVAREIHCAGSNPTGPFVTVNLTAVPHELAESILFGHERGSFTGAHREHIGKFEAASSGTLFLDEVGCMPLVLQAKLLRVLQEREFERVGARHPIAVRVRIIAATHRNLGDEVQKGSFREDLYYRLKVYPIRIPPLRDRKEQIPSFGKYFLDQYLTEFGKAPISVDPAVWDILSHYDWPGNVRELENLMQRLAVHNQGAPLTPHHIPIELHQQQNRHDSLRDILEHYEREVILRVLHLHRGNQRKAAEHLHVPLSTFKFKLRRCGISRESIQEDSPITFLRIGT